MANTNKKRKRDTIRLMVTDYLEKNGPTNIKDLSKYIDNNTKYHVSSVSLGVLLSPLIKRKELHTQLYSNGERIYSLINE